MRKGRKSSLCDHCNHAYEVKGGCVGMSSINGGGPIDVKQRYCDKPPPDSKNPDIEGRAIPFGGYQECEYYTPKITEKERLKNYEAFLKHMKKFECELYEYMDQSCEESNAPLEKYCFPCLARAVLNGARLE